MRRLTVVITLLVGVGLIEPVHAETEIAPETTVLDRDHISIGVGGIYGPSYEGSDNQVFSPIPLLQGRISGISFSPRAGGLAVNLIPDRASSRFGFSLGPIATYSGNRRSGIKDPVVRSAGRLKRALDLGVSGGVTAYRLLSDYDALTLSTDVKWNVNNAHEGMVVTPSLSYTTPLSPAALATVGVSAKHVDDAYADYYFSVSPTQSAASGLPQFRAKGGWISAGVNLFGAYDLDGDLRNGGFALIGLAGYSRLFNDAGRTPYTAIRGDADQWRIGAGVAYTF